MVGMVVLCLCGATAAADQPASTPAVPRAYSASTDPAKADFEQALDLIHGFNWSDDQHVKAAGFVQQMRKSHPGSPYTLIAEAELAHRLGLNRQGASDAIRKLIDASLKIARDIPDAYVTLAKLELDLRRIPVADRNARQAYKLAPDKPEVRFVMARVAEESRRYDEAEQHYRRYIELSGKPIRQSNTYYAMGRMFARMRPPQVAKGDEAFQKSIKHDPAAPWKHHGYAEFLLFTRGDYEGALFHAGEAARLMQHSTFRHVGALALYAKWADAYAHKGARFKGGYKGSAPLKKPAADDWRKIAEVSKLTPDTAFVEMSGSPALSYAVLTLLDAKAVTNIDVSTDGPCGCPALYKAAEAGNFDLSKALVERGANVNASNRRGETALTRFVVDRDWRAARYVIDHGARVNFIDKDGDAPIHLVPLDNLDGLKLLLDKRADPNVANAQGNTPLSQAVYANRPEAIALLIKHGADPNQQTRLRGNPALLGLAVSLDYKEAVAALLKGGADPSVVDTETYRPFNGATPEIKDMILKARAARK